MRPLIHLDTHVVAWLYCGDMARLGPVLDRIEQSELAISPMVILELQHLYEIGRTTRPGIEVFKDLCDRIGLRMADSAFSRIIDQVTRQTWTRDPFDRLISAQAIIENTPLLTADRTILEHCPLATWA